MQQQIATSPWDAALQAVSEAVLAAADPYTVGAVVTAWALTHGYKLGLEAFFPDMAASAPRWRFCVWTGAVISGALSALVWAFSVTGAYPSIPLIAVLSPLVWRVAVLLPSTHVRRALTTPADRQHMKMDR